MPARSSTLFRCFCSSCTASGGLGPDGQALGKEFPQSQRNSHLNRVKLEREASEQARASFVADVASAVFATTLTDEGPAVKSQPSKLWTSRHQHQLASSTVTLEVPDAISSIDAIMTGVDRLSSTLSPSIASPTSSVDPTIYTHEHPSVSNGPTPPSHRQSKRERNHATRKAHRTLDALNTRALACLQQLKDQPSRTSFEFAEGEVARLRSAFETVKRNVLSVEDKKCLVAQLLSQLDSRILELRDIYPSQNDKPLQYNSDHHFNVPISLHDPVAQLAMFIAIVCSVIMGVSRRMGDLILNLLSTLVGWAFRDRNGNLSAKQSLTLDQIPSTIETVFSKFNLDGRTTTYAICPKCHYTNPPYSRPGSKIVNYPTHCANRPEPDSDICNEPLLENSGEEGELAGSKPLKSFIYPSFHDFVGRLLARKDLENLMDNACDDLMTSIREKEKPPKFVTDPFQAEFLRSFEGPIPGRLFIDRPDNEGRYVFSLNVDFFNSEGMSIRGPSVSSGIISAACLNLPLDIRYKPENMYVCIIPGPKEPHLTELNHYLRPIIDDLSDSWHRGVHYSRTANHESGRDTRCGIACAVCDLPAARKVSATANPTSHFYCTVCSCFHTSTLGRTDFNSPDWLPKDVKALRKCADAWKNASTAKERVNLFQQNGIRWSELWRLPYWNPTRMLVVDSMHCLLEGLAQFHFRDVLKLTSANANLKEKPTQAFEFAFPQPPVADIPPDMTDNEAKQIGEIHGLLQAPVVGGDDPTILQANLDLLTDKLERKNMKPLTYVTKGLGIDPVSPGRITKRRRAEALVRWRKENPLSAGDLPIRTSTPEAMACVKQVIREMATPSWLPSVPKNFGDAAAGTPKADEWRTMTTVYFPVALISMWGDGSTHPSPAIAASFRRVLDHTMALVSAVSIACMRTMTEGRMSAYREYLASWASDLKALHPESNHRVNGHMAFHIYDFLRLFGPVHSWWCFPFERLIGQLQRLPHNHKHGELETTMLSSFIRAANLKHWLARPDCPLFIKECKHVFDKAFGAADEDDKNVIAPSAFQPVPPFLRGIIKARSVALRARHRFDNVVFSRMSTHLGNSLIMFYPNGNLSSTPIPGSVHYIVAQEDGTVVYVIRRQLPISSDVIDPFAAYPHFHARLYSTTLSEHLEVVRPEWVLSHYARWNFNDQHAVVLTLSRD